MRETMCRSGRLWVWKEELTAIWGAKVSTAQVMISWGVWFSISAVRLSMLACENVLMVRVKVSISHIFLAVKFSFVSSAILNYRFS
jgi:hypothetical protein